jgi:hypothetical protein
MKLSGCDGSTPTQRLPPPTRGRRAAARRRLLHHSYPTRLPATLTRIHLPDPLTRRRTLPERPSCCAARCAFRSPRGDTVAFRYPLPLRFARCCPPVSLSPFGRLALPTWGRTNSLIRNRLSLEAIEAHAYNMSPSDRRTARRIIFEHFDYIVSQWNEFQAKKHG